MECRHRGNTNIHRQSLSPAEEVASMLTPPPSHPTHSGRKELHSVLYSIRAQSHPTESFFYRPCHSPPLDPPPPPPSCRKPRWGEESPSLLFSFYHPLLTLTSSNCLSFPSSTHLFINTRLLCFKTW